MHFFFQWQKTTEVAFRKKKKKQEKIVHHLTKKVNRNRLTENKSTKVSWILTDNPIKCMILFFKRKKFHDCDFSRSPLFL